MGAARMRHVVTVKVSQLISKAVVVAETDKEFTLLTGLSGSQQMRRNRQF